MHINQHFRCMRFLGLIILLVTLTFSMIGQSIPLVHGQLSPGDILVTDNRSSIGESGLLFQVDPTTGIRTVLSDFGDASQGPLGWIPGGVAIENSGTILVTDGHALSGHGALFRIDPKSGIRTILSDFGDASQGPLGGYPEDVVVEATGAILVVDQSAGTDQLGVLFRIDPTTGTRTILSDFGDASQGPLGFTIVGLAIEASGAIVVIDVNAGVDPQRRGMLFRVDSVTGERTVLSDFGDASQGPLGRNPVSMTIEASGAILVTEYGSGTDRGGGAMMGALFRVDPTTGIRIILSDFGDALQGPLGGDPYDFPSDVAVEASGSIVVVDAEVAMSEFGVLFRIDPKNGIRTVFSNFSNISQGPLGTFPSGLTIIPVPAVTSPMFITATPMTTTTIEKETEAPQETATITVTKETLVILTPETETPVAFVPGFEVVELGLALGCLLIGVRIRRKQ